MAIDVREEVPAMEEMPRWMWHWLEEWRVQQRRQVDALEDVAAELKRLRVLQEYHQGVRVVEDRNGVRVEGETTR